MNLFFSSTDFAVSTLVMVAVLTTVAGLGSWGLYRPLLRSLVEYGEWHPANVRRLLWVVFVTLTAVAVRLTLASWLRPAATVALVVIVVVFSLLLLVTHKRV